MRASQTNAHHCPNPTRPHQPGHFPYTHFPPTDNSIKHRHPPTPFKKKPSLLTCAQALSKPVRPTPLANSTYFCGQHSLCPPLPQIRSSFAHSAALRDKLNLHRLPKPLRGLRVPSSPCVKKKCPGQLHQPGHFPYTHFPPTDNSIKHRHPPTPFKKKPSLLTCAQALSKPVRPTPLANSTYFCGQHSLCPPLPQIRSSFAHSAALRDKLNLHRLPKPLRGLRVPSSPCVKKKCPGQLHQPGHFPYTHSFPTLQHNLLKYPFS